MHPAPPMSVPFGLPELDDVTGGMRPGHLIVVASAPGAGKTTLLLQFLRHATFRHGCSTHLISLEMTDSDIRQRLLSGESGIRLHSVEHPATGNLDRAPSAATLAKAEALTNQGTLAVDSRTSFSIADLPLTFYQEQDQILAVDCIDLVDADASPFTVARAFKKYALETEMPVLVSTRVRDNSPHADALMEEADMVLLLERPDTTGWDHERAGEADIHVVKNRMGPIARITMQHQLFRSRFVPLGQS